MKLEGKHLSWEGLTKPSQHMQIKEKHAPFTTHELFSHYNNTVKSKDFRLVTANCCVIQRQQSNRKALL